MRGTDELVQHLVTGSQSPPTNLEREVHLQHQERERHYLTTVRECHWSVVIHPLHFPEIPPTSTPSPLPPSLLHQQLSPESVAHVLIPAPKECKLKILLKWSKKLAFIPRNNWTPINGCHIHSITAEKPAGASSLQELLSINQRQRIYGSSEILPERHNNVSYMSKDPSWNDNWSTQTGNKHKFSVHVLTLTLSVCGEYLDMRRKRRRGW